MMIVGTATAVLPTNPWITVAVVFFIDHTPEHPGLADARTVPSVGVSVEN